MTSSQPASGLSTLAENPSAAVKVRLRVVSALQLMTLEIRSEAVMPLTSISVSPFFPLFTRVFAVS